MTQFVEMLNGMRVSWVHDGRMWGRIDSWSYMCGIFGVECFKKGDVLDTKPFHDRMQGVPYCAVI
jgi:hypothetical protein